MTSVIWFFLKKILKFCTIVIIVTPIGLPCLKKVGVPKPWKISQKFFLRQRRSCLKLVMLPKDRKFAILFKIKRQTSGRQNDFCFSKNITVTIAMCKWLIHIWLWNFDAWILMADTIYSIYCDSGNFATAKNIIIGIFDVFFLFAWWIECAPTGGRSA